MEIRFTTGIALVKDIMEAKHFYKDILGLPVSSEYDTIVKFENHFAIHKVETFYEYINKSYHGEKLGHDNVDFYFTTTDLEEVQKKLKAEKVNFIHEIRQCDWGEKVLRVYDPDGHIVEIGDAFQ